MEGESYEGIDGRFWNRYITKYARGSTLCHIGIFFISYEFLRRGGKYMREIVEQYGQLLLGTIGGILVVGIGIAVIKGGLTDFIRGII